MSESNTALITLATALITGGVALFGVYLTNRENTKRLKLQLKHSSDEKKVELFRSRAEELYELTDEWLKGIISTKLNLTYVMEGKFDYNTHLDSVIEYGDKNKSNFTRLEMILDVYFPELKPLFESVTEVRTIINNISAEHKKEYKNGDLDGRRFVKPITDALLELERRGDKFKEKIAMCAKDA